MKSYQRLSIILLIISTVSCKEGTVVQEKGIENPAQTSTVLEESSILMSNLDSITLFKVIENADPNKKIIEIRYELNQEQEELVDHTHTITRDEIEITTLDSLALKILISFDHIRELFFYGDKSSIGQKLTLSKAEYHITPIDSYVSLQYESSKPSNFAYATNFSQLDSDDFIDQSDNVPTSFQESIDDLSNFHYFTNQVKDVKIGLLTTEKSSSIIGVDDNENPVELYRGKGDNYVIAIKPLPIFINKQPILFAEMGHPDFDEVKEIILYSMDTNMFHRILTELDYNSSLKTSHPNPPQHRRHPLNRHWALWSGA